MDASNWSYVHVPVVPAMGGPRGVGTAWCPAGVRARWVPGRGIPGSTQPVYIGIARAQPLLYARPTVSPGHSSPSRASAHPGSRTRTRTRLRTNKGEIKL